jgi:hypothetical protein
MRWLLVFILFSLASLGAAQSKPSSPSTSKSNAATTQGRAQNPPVIQTEKIQVPETMQAPPPSMASQPGYMLPSQAKQLLVKIWDSEQRLNDLLSQIHPEGLKMSPVAAKTLEQNIKTVHENVVGLENARARFAGRPDSEYFGFETFAAISVLLPRLSEIADTVYRHQNQSLGSDIRQAWTDLFTREQALVPYVSFLTRNHDQIYTLTQGNLYTCQTQLNEAMRGKTERAVPMRNILPEFKGHPRHRKKPAAAKAQGQKPR